jgi:hypothetical protein
MARSKPVTLPPFNNGVYNAIGYNTAPPTSAKSNDGWITTQGWIETALGRTLWGDRSTDDGEVSFSWVFDVSPQLRTPSRTEDKLHMRVAGTKLQVLVDETWTSLSDGASTDLITSGAYVSANYFASVSGKFVYVMTEEKIFRIDPFNPEGDVTNLFLQGTTFSGKFFFDRGRTVLWGREKDKNAVYLSHIDFNNNYTAVSSEACGTGNISRTLTALSSNPERIAFGVVVTTPDGAFTDNRFGGFTDFNGDTVDSENFNANGYKGYINYSTGELVLTKQSTPFGSCTVSYSWQNPRDKAILDFATTSTPRVNGEYDFVRQDKNGTEILAVIPHQGVYYSFKDRGAYMLQIPPDDSTGITNLPINNNITIANGQCVVSTDKGIIYIDVENKNNPFLGQFNPVNENTIVTPEKIAPQFDFSLYRYSQARMTYFGGRVYIACQTKIAESQGIGNDVVLIYDVFLQSVDVITLPVASWAVSRDTLYVGDTLTHNSFIAFNAFDDDGTDVTQSYECVYDNLGYDGQKRIRRVRLKGRITKYKQINVYMAYDHKDSYELIGTIDGSDYDSSVDDGIGSDEIGSSDIGGETIITEQIGGYYVKDIAQISTPRFETRSLKFEATGYGYASVEVFIDYDVRVRDYRLVE